jgi:uncharacterized protein (DUF1330 family)
VYSVLYLFNFHAEQYQNWSNFMAVNVLGLIELKDPSAFEKYRAQVGATVEQYGGRITQRGACGEVFWNALECKPFSAFVQLEFPTAIDAQRWAASPEYLTLLPIRNQAMQLTLFSILPNT